MLCFNDFKCFLVLLILCYLTRPVLSDCLNAPIENFDYFPNKISFDNDGIRDFDVTYNNNYIIVRNNKVFETYVLYCGATQPVGTDIPVNTTRYVQVPVTNVAVNDRATFSFLEILGEESKLKYVGDKSAITSPCLQKHNDLYETVQFSNTTQVESIGVIFTKIPAQTGGNFVTISMDENTQALKKAEWIKFISLFFNKTDVANEAFSKIQSNYLCHQENVSKVPNETRKSIAWVYLESDNTFTVEFGLFYTNVTLDAAAIPLLMLTSVSTTDELHQIINDAYIVIDMSELVAPNDTLDSWKRIFGYQTSNHLPRFLTQKRLFRTRKLLNKMAYDDWTETSPSRPDLILQDLIAIQYPSYQKDYNVTWLEKFAETGDIDIISEEQCNENTFGLPKTDFGTCVSSEFTGVDGKDDHDKHHDHHDNDEKKKVNPGIVIAGALIGSLVGFGLGAWLFVVARRRYRERFVKLSDEHESQSVN